jgi:hypothetical protein
MDGWLKIPLKQVPRSPAEKRETPRVKVSPPEAWRDHLPNSFFHGILLKVNVLAISNSWQGEPTISTVKKNEIPVKSNFDTQRRSREAGHFQSPVSG